jgi:hypothetical protein
MLEVMRTVRTIGIAAVSGLIHARRFGKTESAECPKEHTAADVYTALEMASVRVDISLRTCAYTDAISADEPP